MRIKTALFPKGTPAIAYTHESYNAKEGDIITSAPKKHHDIKFYPQLSTVDTASPAHLYMGLRKEKEKNVV